MDARYAMRKTQWLEECQVAPERFEQVMPRLHTLMEPFVDTLCGPASPQHAKTSVSGLLSDAERKHVASIADHFGQDRLGLQRFIGWAAWDDAPLRQVVIDHVGKQWGHADGVLVFDPSACAQSGPESVGVARQWCGRLGNVDNGHVALSVGDVSRKGHPLVDMRLSLPTEWTQDKARLDNAGVPKAHRGSRTRHQVALAMREQDGASLPHRWRAGDDEMGRPDWLRRRLAALGARYVVAVPSQTLMRALEIEPPVSSGRGRPPPRPWQRVEQGCPSLDDEAWRRIDVRDGAKGPLVVDVVKRRVASRTHRRQQGDEETVVVMRYRDRDNQQVVKVDYSLSNAAPETPLGACARVANAAHRLEACLQRSTSAAGLADDEGRNWTGGQHHHTLSFLATWFLERETHRGENMAACTHVPADPSRHRDDRARGVAVRHDVAYVG
jgi:SRSO17 transposase